MFSIEDFTKDVKNIYSSEITIEHDIELQNLIDSFRCYFEILIEQILHGWFYALTNHSCYLYYGTLQLMLQQGHKHFIYVRCSSPTYIFPMFLFFDKYELQTVYQKVLRIEKLKVFL